MHGLVANRHQITRPIGQRVFDIPIFLNALALLVENERYQVFTEPHIAAIGRQRPQKNIQQSSFARPIGANKTDATAALNLRGKIIDQFFLPISFGNFIGFNDQLAGAVTGLQHRFHIALRAAIIAPRLA